MTDIVERLRKCGCEDGWAILLWQYAQQAADEIERLRAALSAMVDDPHATAAILRGHARRALEEK